MTHCDKKNGERGSALLIAMIALALLLAVGFVMTFATMAETRIDGNFRLHKQSYYASHAGLEEIRDRMRYPSTATPGGLSDLLPQGIPGAASGALYVVNPSAGEAVNPADTANKYFDFEFCHEYDPNAIAGQKCTAVPGIANWELPAQNALQTAQTAGQPLSYKWVRINLKTDRVAQPYCVDGACAAATLDNRVCWDGTEEVLAPDVATTCGALNMHPVYMLSSYSSSLGARTLSRYEVASIAVRPPGALNLESQQSAPSFNDSSQGTGDRIPTTNIDGRPRDLNGNLLPAGTGGCESTPPIATDGSNSTTNLQNALDTLRQKIVQRAIAFCNGNGSPGSCTSGLAWVNANFTDDSNNCNASSPSCYKNLNLSAPQLDAQTPLVGPVSAPFIGAPGNVDPFISQVNTNSLQSQISTIEQVVSDDAGQPNFFTIPNSTISSNVTYGSVNNPAIVVAGDSGGLQIQNGATVTGYGILVVPNNLEINSATFQWTGIVLVQPPSGEFRLDQGANGFINGALMMQADANGTTNVRTSDSPSGNFTISYSCDAIDLAFRTAPLKIISYSEIAY